MPTGIYKRTSEMKTGRHNHSEETKRKLSEIDKKRYANGEKFGFQKGHPDLVTKEGRKRQSKKIRKHLWKPNYFQKGNIPWYKKYNKPHPHLGKKIKHSEETKKKISLTIKKQYKNGRIAWIKGKERLDIKGDKNPAWNGGSSFEPYSIDWTDTLKRSIRERDHYICQLCSQYGNYVHHIDYNKKNCNPSNLITLCVGCNSKVNKNRNYWLNYFINKQKYGTAPNVI
jgi:hypothetical protein